MLNYAIHSFIAALSFIVYEIKSAKGERNLRNCVSKNK